MATGSSADIGKQARNLLSYIAGTAAKAALESLESCPELRWNGGLPQRHHFLFPVRPALHGRPSVADAGRAVVKPSPACQSETPVSDLITHVSDDAFQKEVLESDTPVLLDFWAEWCGPCKAIAPMLNDLAEEYRDKLTIVKLNVDENPKTSQRFNVRSIPTLILFKNGQVEGQKVGAPRKSDLVAFLDSKL